MADEIAECLFIFVVRRAKSQLAPEIFDDLSFASHHLLLINWLAGFQAEVFAQFVAGTGIHADQNATVTFITA